MKRFILPLLTTGMIAGMLVTAGCEGYYYTSAPPPVRVEARLNSPGSDYVWIDGYWGGGRNDYAWVPGRWERPPRGHSTWVAPSWEQHGGKYRFHKGHWR